VQQCIHTHTYTLYLYTIYTCYKNFSKNIIFICIIRATCKEWRGGEINPDGRFKRKAGPKN